MRNWGQTPSPKTSYVVIDDLLVNIDTELDFKYAESMLQQDVSPDKPGD